MPTHCLNCGYEAPLENGPCPECGTPLTPRFFETESGKRWLKALRAADRAGRVARISLIVCIVSIPIMMATGIAVVRGKALPPGSIVSEIVRWFLLTGSAVMTLAGLATFAAFQWTLFRLAAPLTVDTPPRATLASASAWVTVMGAIMLGGVTALNYANAVAGNIERALLESAAALACATQVILAAYLVTARAHLVQTSDATPLWKRSPVRSALANSVVGLAVAAAFIFFKPGSSSAFAIFWIGWLMSAWMLSRTAEAMRKRAEQASLPPILYTDIPEAPSASASSPL